MLVKTELHNRRYTEDYAKRIVREASIEDVLFEHRFLFSHFATLTFAVPVTEYYVVESVHRALRSLDGVNQQRIKYFYEISLSPKHQFVTTERDVSGEKELRTRWHVHALLGGFRDSLSEESLETTLSSAYNGRVMLQRSDGSRRLYSYVASSNTGNLVGALQRTNVSSIRNVLAQKGIVI